MSDSGFAWQSAEIISASKIRDTDNVRVIFESCGQRREEIFRPFLWTDNEGGPTALWLDCENAALGPLSTHNPELSKTLDDILLSVLNGRDFVSPR
jgi:hypothetical protein